MNKMKKLLSVLLAVLMVLSSMTVMASAAKTAYKTVDELNALGAYSPYGQVTRLSTEERTSIVFDALDNLLPSLNINMGEVFNVLGLSVTIDFTSVDRICYSLDTIKDTFENTLASIAMAIVNLGILESLETGKWETGMTRDTHDQYYILSTLLAFLSDNTTLVGKVFTDGLDLGLVSLGDMSAIEDIIMDLPSMVKGIIFPMLERKDDTLADIKNLDTWGTGNGNVEIAINTFVQSLFVDNRSTTTVKYDVDGNMTSEHTGLPIVTTEPDTTTEAASTAPRYVYYKDADGNLWTYHIADAKEADTVNNDADDTNNVTLYAYVKEEIPYTLQEEVAGNGVYTWQAQDAWGNKWTLKYYNDNSPWLPSLKAALDAGTVSIDLSSDSVSAGDLLYTFIPYVFGEMAPVVLNGSMKKILGGLFGAKYNYVGDVGSDAVAALADSSDTFFTEEQGEYLWEWSNYIAFTDEDGTNPRHYYRFEDQIFEADLSNVNNYFYIINWNYEITADFMNEFIPADDSDASVRMLQNVNDFLVKVANTVLLETAETENTSGNGTDAAYEATWTRPTFTSGNANLVANIKALAQAFIKLAPQHIFGSDYAENDRCYYELMISDDNDTVLVGIAAQLVDMIMPSMTLPGKTEILASNAKVGAILAAVIREFAAYLAPEYNYDALIYADFGTTTDDPDKTFVDPEAAGLLTDGETAAGYWLDVCLTMGLDVGYEYLRAFADLGEDTTYCAGATDAGYGAAGKTYTAGTTQATLNAQWEGMLDYIIDFALSSETEWAWRFEKIVNTTGLTVSLATIEDPWAKLDVILLNLLPIEEILTINTVESTSKVEQFLRYDLILGIVNLEWDALIDTIQLNGTNNYFRTGNILDQLALLLKNLINGIFAKVGGGSFALIPDAMTDFDTLANQDNLVTMIKSLVGVLYTAGVTQGGCDVLFPFLNFLLGWKTDPQKIADPVIWTSFRDGNDYAFQWTGNGVYPEINDGATVIKVLNNSSGMLEIHRDSDVTDHAYDINIVSITSDATVNTLNFTYDSVVSPYETIDIVVGGTYNGEEAATITIAYDYVGKDGVAVGGTQYTSLTVLFSNQYEDSNISGRKDGDDDTDYAGIHDFGQFQFTKDIYTTVTEYKPEIFQVKATTSDPSLSWQSTTAPDQTGTQTVVTGTDSCGNDVTEEVPVYCDMTGNAATYFDYYTGQDGGWPSTIASGGGTGSGYLYKAASGVTADTEFPYGVYDMGQVAVKYKSSALLASADSKVWNIDFIYYNDYNIYDLYTDNKDNGYHANMGVDSAIYTEYNEAWKDIVKYATYPMMTSANGNSATDYVTTIQPYIPAAIERFEAALEAFELAKAEANSAGSAANLPEYVQKLEAQLALDDGKCECEGECTCGGEKEVNFQDYEFYEYFNYADLRTAHRNFIKTYYAPEIMDTYYIEGSGIREAELNNVIAAEDNTAIAAGIAASRMQNDQAAIDASIVAHNEWQMPVDSKLLVDDMTSRLAYYKTFLTGKEEPNSHLQFLNLEIAHIDAQQLVEDDYTADSWAKFQEAYDYAATVVAGTADYSSCNSTIYNAKWNLMVAYKNLLLKADSLIEAGGTADLMANRAIADEIFASIYAQDGAWTVKEGVDEETAFAELIAALGYYYVGEDGNTWNLYADSALEYIDNDRPNRQSNQAKVNTANNNLEAAIANFEATATEPVLSGVDTGVVDTENGYVYGVVAGSDDLTLFFTVENGTFEMVANDGGYTNGTGATLVVKDTKGNEVATYTLVVFGDVNGDAQVTAADSVLAKMAGLGSTIEGEAYAFAADVNADGSVTAADSVSIKMAGLGGDITVNPYAA